MERLRLDNLDQYLLVKNGNFLYKVPFRGGHAVLKLYYGSRSRLEYVLKTLDNVLICGQTSFMPKARLRTEQNAMRVWREAGFRVFDIYPDVEVDGLPPGGYALYEYVPGRNLHRVLPNSGVPLEERVAVYREFLTQWHRRHRLAVDRREPRLIHENGDLKHVLVHGKELCWFDFEMCYRSPEHVEDLVAREILTYLKSLASFVPGDLFDLFFRETLAGYPDKDLLRHAHTFAFHNRDLVVRLARGFDYRFGRNAHRTNSKYAMALKVKAGLDGQP